MEYYTDHPFTSLGDTENCIAPIRRIKLIQYDGDKYCKVAYGSAEEWIKTGYIYKDRRRFNPEISDNIDFSEFKI